MHVGGMSCVFTQVPWPNRYMMYLGRSLPHAFAKALKKFGLVLHYFRKSLATWRHLLHYSRVYLPSEGRNALSNLSLKPVSTFARTSLCEMLPRSILDTSVQIGLISLIHVDFWVSWLTFSLTSFYHLRPISSFSIPFHRDAYLKGKKPSCLFTGKHLVQSFKSCQSSRFDSALRRRAWQRKCEPQTMLMCKIDHWRCRAKTDHLMGETSWQKHGRICSFHQVCSLSNARLSESSDSADWIDSHRFPDLLKPLLQLGVSWSLQMLYTSRSTKNGETCGNQIAICSHAISSHWYVQACR